MVVVNGVQVVVLCVPGKGAEQHADVQHGTADARQLGTFQVAQQGAGLLGENLYKSIGKSTFVEKVSILVLDACQLGTVWDGTCR